MVDDRDGYRPLKSDESTARWRPIGDQRLNSQELSIE